MSWIANLPAGLLRPLLSYLSRQQLPRLDGTLRLEALRAPVNVTRDLHAVPHVTAATRGDLFFAQGFVHAQDRLWQMESLRRVAAGTLAAVVGTPALPTDRLTRTLGFARLARQDWPLLGEKLQEDLTRYAAGVNACLTRRAQRPLEFRLLGHQMEPWHPLDSVAISRLMMWTLSTGWAGELIRARLTARVGARLAAELEPAYPERHPVILPDGIDFNERLAAGVLEAAQGPFLFRDAEGGGRGSNGWVIGAERSASGAPLLCNDLHLPLSAPSLWYLIHLQSSDGLHVAGASLPGLPYIFVGHNQQIAWGTTLAYTDVEDLFVEKVNGNRYLFRDEWRALTVVEERIEVKGAASHVEQVRKSHHGPLVGDLVPAADGGEDNQVLAMASTALGRENGLRGFALLNETRNWNQFVSAVRRMATPPLNVLYADVDKNIGYYTAGRIPIRARGQGLTPAPGWAGDHEWEGYVPFEEMPHALNPRRGYIVCGNNRIIGDDYPHFLGAVWRDGSRAARIEALIRDADRVTLEDGAALQMDVYSRPGMALVKQLAGLEPDDPDAEEALEVLRRWDGHLTADSAGGAVAEMVTARLAEIILEPHLGRELLDRFLGGGTLGPLAPTNELLGYWPWTLLRLLEEGSSGWLPGRFGKEAILTRALAETTQTLRRRLGPDPRQWRWGQLQQIHFRHLLDQGTSMGRVLGQGPLSAGGSPHTVQQIATPSAGGSTIGASYRQLFDLADWDTARAIIPPGQSGHLASPHYADLLEKWRQGESIPLGWGLEKIESEIRYRLRLTPGSAPAG